MPYIVTIGEDLLPGDTLVQRENGRIYRWRQGHGTVGMAVSHLRAGDQVDMFDTSKIITSGAISIKPATATSSMSRGMLVYAPRLPWYKRLWYWLRRKPLPVVSLTPDADVSKPIGEAIDDKHIRLHF